MATMLAYILTDLNLPRTELQSILSKCVDRTFNSISVDGDQSTSDTCLLLSSKQVTSSAPLSSTINEFTKGLTNICQSLSEDIVRNGEGTQHVIKVRIQGLSSSSSSSSSSSFSSLTSQQIQIGKRIGKSIVNSNLVKCAISGCDPNVGRIVGAIGSCIGNVLQSGSNNDIQAMEQLQLDSLEIYLGGYPIFAKNAFKLDPQTEELLSNYMYDCQLFQDKTILEQDRIYPPHERSVELIVRFVSDNNNINNNNNNLKYPSEYDPNQEVLVIGSDLTEEYVQVNADYRS
jgi:glutamate N-acetyltransferase / amino-acid N-acetyltransferase